MLARTDNNDDRNMGAHTAIISGVPVHNYHLRHEIANLTESSSLPVYDWILELKGRPDGDEVH
jgi:hypothetical protein